MKIIRRLIAKELLGFSSFISIQTDLDLTKTSCKLKLSHCKRGKNYELVQDRSL